MRHVREELRFEAARALELRVDREELSLFQLELARSLPHLLLEADVHLAKLVLLILERLRHAVERVGELAELITTADLNARSPIAGGDAARGRRDLLDRRHEHARQEDDEDDADRHDDDRD